ncbi:hypothetical protein FB451DRAFT_1171510 [Mycena latifolia]|nr:hypothetical protein FB451DRAFT_1171510 [Mycena latifolia]
MKDPVPLAFRPASQCDLSPDHTATNVSFCCRTTLCSSKISLHRSILSLPQIFFSKTIQNVCYYKLPLRSPLPLPPTFDCDAHATRPADRAPPDGMELEDKNAENVIREASNKASIALTRAYAAARGTVTGVGTLDVGAPLMALWSYTDEEKAMLLHSPDLVAAVGPLPLTLTKLIAQHRAAIGVQREEERADKEAEKAKTANLLGSMMYTNPHEVTPLLRQAATIPSIFLVSLRHAIYFPLHWWTDRLLRKAAESPHTICKEFSRAEQSASYSIGERVQVVDVMKCAKLFDGEDEVKCLTPSLWRQAANNLLSAFQKLCPAADPADPSARNHASELVAHFLWMAVWLPIERKLRYALMAQGYFKAETWADEVRSVLSAHEHAAALASTYALAASAPAPTGAKRLSADEGDAQAKRVRREALWELKPVDGCSTCDSSELESFPVWLAFLDAIKCKVHGFSRAAVGTFSDAAEQMKRCGYFGPKSQAIIMTTIDKMLTGTLPQDQIYQTVASLLNTPRPWNKPDKNSELAFPLNFVDYVLVPYVAASLIAEDLETTFEAAFAILLESSDFGDIFNDIDPSAEDSPDSRDTFFRIPSPLHEHTKVASPVPSRRKEKYEKSHLMISPWYGVFLYPCFTNFVSASGENATPIETAESKKIGFLNLSSNFFFRRYGARKVTKNSQNGLKTAQNGQNGHFAGPVG